MITSDREALPPTAGGPPAVTARKGAAARQRRRVALLLLAPTVLMLVALSIFPTVVSAVLSFRVEPLYNPKVARFVGWRNYSDLFQDERFWQSIRLTLLWAVVVVGIQMVLGFFLAILLDRKMRGAGLLRTLIIIPVFISPIAMGLTWRFIFEPVSGLANWLLARVGLEPYAWLSDSTLR